MQLVNTKQVSLPDLKDLSIDFFIGASGYEARATHSISCLAGHPFFKKIAIGFNDRLVSHRRKNDDFFINSGVELVNFAGGSISELRDFVRFRLEAAESDEISLFVDYSSMTRSWCAGVLEGITSATNKKKIECFFSYSPSEFEEPLETTPNAIVGPISGFCSLDVAEKPTALIMGLGYEKERALGLFEYIDPAIAFAFYTDPVSDERFLETVVKNNSALLSKLPKSQVYRHPLCDMQRTGNLLASLYSALRDDYRVILAPLGVKPFSLICLLLATRFKELDVWRVSAGEKAAPQNRVPLGPLVILKAVFAN